MTRPLASAFRSEPAADLPEASPGVLRHDASTTIRTGKTTPRGSLIVVLG